ncbi:MAG: SCO1664 family protein [Acidimicrobiia bacterium]|nr:SCO1664 family protein [Acidimicrobiia bacterium]
MPYSSNATLLVEACAGDHSALGVYKPARGERPLWDFPAGLHRREVAAYELARALGWDLVPVTVLRTEGPLGEGSVQAFVDAAFEEHYFTIHERGEHHETLQKLCLFDLVANATDRKGGHVLIDEDDHVWAIDNGLSFHAEFKLRTVIWDYAGEPVPAELCAAVRRFAGEPLPEALADLLDPFERDALVGRATAVAELDCFPTDSTGRRHPWPLV